MKKYVVSLMAVLVVLVASSFTIKEGSVKKEKAATASIWYNFNGNSLFDMCDPSMYSPDENNWPDCPPMVGLIYCEILAQPSNDVEGEPDLMTISNYRMRPVL